MPPNNCRLGVSNSSVLQCQNIRGSRKSPLLLVLVRWEVALRQVVEARVLLVEPDTDRVRGAIALLGDDELRDVLILGLLVVVVVSIDEDNVVGVLLDGAGVVGKQVASDEVSKRWHSYIKRLLDSVRSHTVDGVPENVAASHALHFLVPQSLSHPQRVIPAHFFSLTSVPKISPTYASRPGLCGHVFSH